MEASESVSRFGAVVKASRMWRQNEPSRITCCFWFLLEQRGIFKLLKRSLRHVERRTFKAYHRRRPGASLHVTCHGGGD
jgi:hypothetical protein